MLEYHQQYGTMFEAPPEVGINFVTASEEWMAALEVSDYAEKTKFTYRSLHKSVKNLIGYVDLADINAFYLQGIMATREDWKPATRNLVINMIRNILSHQKKIGRMATVPDLDFYKVKNERDRFLSADEIRRLIKFAKEPLKLMIKIAVATGLRKHNLFNLRWDQIVDGYILVTVKRDKDMRIPIPTQLQDDLQLYNFEQMRDFNSIYLFPTSRGDEDQPRCDRATLGLKELSVKLDLGPITWHTLRHTFASIALKETRNLAIVRDMMGHSNLSTTNRYLHVLDEDKVRAVNQVYRSWSEQPTPNLVDVTV